MLPSKLEIVRAVPRAPVSHVKDEKLAEAARLEADLGRSMNMTPELRTRIEEKIRELRGRHVLAPPVDGVTLWEQYHLLRAIAARLDAGRGTEQDRAMFEAGLREYNTNYARIRGCLSTKVKKAVERAISDKLATIRSWSQ